jgi:protein deglycase
MLREVDIKDYDLIVLPGGLKGAENLRDNADVISNLKRHQEAGKWIAAICASPAVVLAPHNLLGRPPGAATCFPSPKFEAAMPSKTHLHENVVVDDSAKIITSRGPGTSVLFSLSIVEKMGSRDLAERVREGMVVPA